MKVTNHRIICGSEDLDGFLKDIDVAFDDRKRKMEDFLKGVPSTSYSSLAFKTISSYLSLASEKITGYGWADSATQRKKSFGALTLVAEEELCRFICFENHLDLLKDCFK